MTEQEKINSDVQTKLAVRDEKFDKIMEKLSTFHDEMDDFKQEMRDRDNQRNASILAIQNSVQSMQQSLMEMQTSNRNQNVLVIIGVAAMVIAVILK